MIEINLLPVRAARRRESIRLQLSVAGLTIFFVIVCIILLTANLNKREAAVDKQTILVKEEIAKLEKIVGEIEKLKQEKAKLEQKNAVIKEFNMGIAIIFKIRVNFNPINAPKPMSIFESPPPHCAV